ncbi:addiction module protein [Aeoliella sp. ICT_H6.2]|uniref:Addiction module protein n=1 Tax=Aeoliella straminimaris TaxID=2954799 RepID=A0A9X2FJY8_9BACT|nr:addiction module protein [Aeoliella straminimaris]MCO6048106.1 addiction module protein [Aeoliella straminimaris]
MATRLPLSDMTVEEKLQEMEALWKDLSERDYASPNWHADVLQARSAEVNSGQAKFVDWELAKKQIRDAVR